MPSNTAAKLYSSLSHANISEPCQAGSNCWIFHVEDDEQHEAESTAWLPCSRVQNAVPATWEPFLALISHGVKVAERDPNPRSPFAGEPGFRENTSESQVCSGLSLWFALSLHLSGCFTVQRTGQSSVINMEKQGASRFCTAHTQFALFTSELWRNCTDFIEKQILYRIHLGKQQKQHYLWEPLSSF